jgi:hypothetical protein
MHASTPCHPTVSLLRKSLHEMRQASVAVVDYSPLEGVGLADQTVGKVSRDWSVASCTCWVRRTAWLIKPLPGSRDVPACCRSGLLAHAAAATVALQG